MGEGDCRHGWKCSQQLGEVDLLPFASLFNVNLLLLA